MSAKDVCRQFVGSTESVLDGPEIAEAQRLHDVACCRLGMGRGEDVHCESKFFAEAAN